MGQTAGAADTAADTGHTFNEIAGQKVFRGLQQSGAAGFYPIAGNSLQIKFQPLLLQTLGYSVTETTAASKDSAVIGGVVQHALLQ